MHVNITQPHTPEQAISILLGGSTELGTPVAELIFTEPHLTTSFANRNRRPEWVWLAERSGRVVGRTAAYGAPAGHTPWIIDLVDLCTESDRVGIISALLRRAAEDLHAAGKEQVELNIFPPSTWRDEPPQALTDLLAAAKSGGFEILVTRRRFLWTPHAGLPTVDAPLRFDRVSGVDDPILIEAYRSTFTGSLDMHTRQSLLTRNEDELAAEEIADMANYAGPTDGWRVAYDPGGQLVGLVTGNVGERAVIGYVGVVPEQRGQGYARQLLARMTRWQADHATEKVIGETDDQNVPMGAAFEAVGYVQESARIDLVH